MDSMVNNWEVVCGGEGHRKEVLGASVPEGFSDGEPMNGMECKFSSKPSDSDGSPGQMYG